MLDKAFKDYAAKTEFLHKISHSDVYNDQYNIPFYTFCKIAALKDENYFK